jgi:hypothetical protein
MDRRIVPISLSQPAIISLLNFFLKNHHIQFKKIITYKIKWLNEHTTKCLARLSTYCCTPFWWSWLRTCVFTNSSIGLGSHPRDVAYQEKKGCNLNIFISNNKLINDIFHVRWTGRSCWCAWSPNHEFVGSGCRRHTVSAVRTAQTSHAQYMPPIYLSRWMAVWIPAKPPPHSILQDRCPSHIFSLFFWCHTKNHATYFHSN